MTYYVELDSNGGVLQLYSDAPGYAAPPAGLTPVSDADGEAMRQAGFTGWRHVNGASQPPGVDVVAACAEIDAAAELVRAKYCPHPLQALEYQKAYDEAVAWLANQAAPVPQTVQSWVNANAAKSWTALDAANDIKAAGDFMRAKLDAARDVRLMGKAAVAAGTTTAADVIAQLQGL